MVLGSQKIQMAHLLVETNKTYQITNNDIEYGSFKISLEIIMKNFIEYTQKYFFEYLVLKDLYYEDIV